MAKKQPFKTRRTPGIRTSGELGPVAASPDTEADAAFRQQMRALAYRGGAETKRRHGHNPRYYRAVGRMGGIASAKARRARAELASVSESTPPTDAPQTPPHEPPPAFASTTSVRSLEEFIAEMERPPSQPDRNTRHDPRDPVAEAHFARFVARCRQESQDDDLPPWDPFD